MSVCYRLRKGPLLGGCRYRFDIGLISAPEGALVLFFCGSCLPRKVAFLCLCCHGDGLKFHVVESLEAPGGASVLFLCQLLLIAIERVCGSCLFLIVLPW